MELAVLSNNKRTEDEMGVVMQMFKMGLQQFHLRKPRFSTQEMEEYIERIPPRYRKRTIIHSHHELALKYELGGIHLSKKHRKKRFKRWFRFFWYKRRRRDLKISRTCHDLADLLQDRERYDHVLLSPVFQGISSKSHGGGYSERSICSVLERSSYLVYALGGVTPERLPKLREMGFFGAVLAGAIWEEENDRIRVFQEAQEKIREMDAQSELGGGSSGT
ncbi:MAG: thiamine phosphate synthase [Flavobacteriales bacterium]